MRGGVAVLVSRLASPATRLVTWVLALGAATGIAACSHREHSNPFDAANPTTHGRPIGFAALAGDGVVILRWQPVTLPGLSGYLAFRRGPGDSLFRPLEGLLPTPTGQLTDFAVVNGGTYAYRLYYALSGEPAGGPSEAAATPGRLRPWVTDYQGGTLLRLTPDARNVLSSESGFAGPTQLAVDPASRAVWVCDTNGDRVVLYRPGDGGRIEFPNLAAPFGIVVDASNRTAWVCESERHRVLHLSETGTALPERLEGITDPLALALDPVDRSVWVCDNQGDRVRHFAADGTPLASAVVVRPSRAVVDSTTRRVWVTSFSSGRIVRLGADGTVQDTLGGVSGPIGIDVDPAHGRIWVADALAGQVVALDPAGLVGFRVAGLTEVHELAVDRRSGEAWATVPGLGSVVRLSPAGAITARLAGFSEPYAIALDPGPP
jgi:DNA-binding beta-propeller fold protein YncE